MIETAAVVRFGLLILRPGMMVATAPVLGGQFVPVPVRIALGVLLGIMIAPLTPVPATPAPLGLALAVASELLIGMAIGMGVRLLIAAAELGGHLAGFQMGLSYAALVDPQSGVRNNVIAALYGNIALVTFMAIDGHHSLVRALVASYESIPIGGANPSGPLGALVAQMLGLVFVTGVRLAAPVVTVLLVVELALGLLSRAAPSLNLMVVGTPIRLLAGFAALAVGIQVIPSVVSSLARPTVEITSRLLEALG